MAAKLAHDNHGGDRPAAEAAALFAKWSSKQPELGKDIPMLPAPALIRRDDLSSCVEIVLVIQEALNAAAKQFLVFSQLNVHPAFPSQAQHRFCDDVVLNFIRPAVDA